MSSLITYFTPQPQPDELPALLPSPFADAAPPAIARRAAAQLEAQLRQGQPVPWELWQGVRCGKMFGVLIVADQLGKIGYLRGFSGMIEGRWAVDGFVGPLFDPVQRAAVWPAGQAELAEFDRRLHQLSCGPQAAAQAQLAALDADQAAAVAALAVVHEERRLQRQRARSALSGLSPDEHRGALQALAQESRADTVAERGQRTHHRLTRAPLLGRLRALADERAVLKRRQAERSGQLLELLYAGYRIDSARGQSRSLRALFAPAAPPGGAGDCAGPKLFGHALHTGLRPLALAEFWVGAPPSAAGRQGGIGVYHPSCQRKCGPVLGHMLDGLAIAPA